MPAKDVVLDISIHNDVPVVTCHDPADCPGGGDPDVWKGRKVTWVATSPEIDRWFVVFPASPFQKNLFTDQPPTADRGTVTGKKNADYYYFVAVKMKDGSWKFADPRIMVRDEVPFSPLEDLIADTAMKTAAQLEVISEAVIDLATIQTALAEGMRRLTPPEQSG